MDRTAAGPELETAHVPRRRSRHGDHEVAEDIGPVGAAACTRAASRRGRARRAATRRSSGRSGGTSDGFPSASPAFTQRSIASDLLVGEAALAGEVAEPGFRLPRRHVAARGHRGDLRRALTNVAVGEEAERRGAVRPMARRALAVEDRRDVVRERDRRLDRRRAGPLRAQSGRRQGLRSGVRRGTTATSWFWIRQRRT